MRLCQAVSVATMGENWECIKNFGVETPRKTTTCKTRGDIKMDLSNTHCKDSK